MQEIVSDCNVSSSVVPSLNLNDLSSSVHVISDWLLYFQVLGNNGVLASLKKMKEKFWICFGLSPTNFIEVVFQGVFA